MDSTVSIDTCNTPALVTAEKMRHWHGWSKIYVFSAGGGWIESTKWNGC